MTEIKIYCDHCKKAIDPMYDFDDLAIDLGASYFRTDLCRKCFDNFNEMAKKYCNKEGAE